MTAPVKRYTVELYPGAPELHEVVLAGEYERLEQECERLRDLLRQSEADLLDWRMSFPDANCSVTDALLDEIDDALQAKPDHIPDTAKTP